MTTTEFKMKTHNCIYCSSKIFCKNMCGKHYRQIQQHGYILNRTMYDKNKIFYHDTYAEIVLYDKNQNIIGKAKIDLEDVDKCKKYKWGLGKNKYVGTRINTKYIYLHKFLLDLKNEIDHINHDTLDNRKQNLRKCSRNQNNINRLKSCGIYWLKKRKKYVANIGINYKLKYLGSFSTKEEAITARKNAEIQYYGEYRCQR